MKDSLRFWIARLGFRIPSTGFQSLLVELGFWIPVISEMGIPRHVFRIPKTTIPDSTRKISWISLHGVTERNRDSFSQLRIKPPTKVCHRTQLLILSEL